MLFRRKKVALVLGGGGVRGLSHFGILKVLEREQIPIDMIVGTSAGAIAGAVYAMHGDIDKTIRRVLRFLHSPLFRRQNLQFTLGRVNGIESFFRRLFKGIKKQVAMELLFRRSAIFHGNRLEQVITGLVGSGTFEDLRIPLAVTAIDLRKGSEVILNRGPLLPALTASSAVPGFFPPISHEGMLLADAGLINNMPVHAAKALGAEVVIAVNLSAHIEEMGAFGTGIEVVFRNEEIGAKIMNDLRAETADIVIQPNLSQRYWLDFDDLDGILEAGEQAALACLDELKKKAGELKFGLGVKDAPRAK